MGRLCLKITMLCVFEFSICLSIRPFFVCVGIKKSFAKRPWI